MRPTLTYVENSDFSVHGVFVLFLQGHNWKPCVILLNFTLLLHPTPTCADAGPDLCGGHQRVQLVLVVF